MESIYAAFPESFYLPSKEFLNSYLIRCEAGYNLAAKTSVIITGLARNIAHNKNLLSRLDKTASLFKEVFFVFFENDSNDGTLEILKNFTPKRKDDDVHVVTDTFNHQKWQSDRSLSRLDAMAYYRNRCLQHIRNFIQHEEYPFTIIIDTDLKGGWSYEGIANSFGYFYDLNFDCMASNSYIYDIYEDKPRRLYYDSFAFRFSTEVKPDFEAINRMQLNRGELPFQVCSAFGGLGIYKTKSIIDKEYKGGDCEHLHLHKQLDKVYVNPSQIVLLNEHQYTVK